MAHLSLKLIVAYSVRYLLATITVVDYAIVTVVINYSIDDRSSTVKISQADFWHFQN